MHSYVTILAKTRHVRTKTEFNFIAAVYRHTQYLSIPLYQVSNANWSAFLKGILLTLQSHSFNNGTHGGCQLDSGDLYLLPLAVWPTGVLLATVWASWLPTHPPLPVPPHPIPPPIPPTPPYPTSHSTHPLYYQY